MAVDITNYLSTQRGSVATVDPAGGQDALSSGQTNLSSSYETFLALLTAQLKNQDPLAPLDTNSFTQQLVQMTGVQQQLLSNQLLQQLVTQGTNGSVQDALGLIGQSVTATGTDAALSGGKASWAYELPKTANQATLTVTDSGGRVMWSGPAPNLAKGQHAFVWDGKGTNDGVDGQTYKLTVTATDSNGLAMTPTTYTQGLVTAVRQAATGPMVNVSGVEVPLTAIMGVATPATSQTASTTSTSSTGSSGTGA
jgi:flagellar basal-body rod modification protein FlgD